MLIIVAQESIQLTWEFLDFLLFKARQCGRHDSNIKQDLDLSLDLIFCNVFLDLQVLHLKNDDLI